MSQVKISVRDMSVGELIDRVIDGEEFLVGNSRMIRWDCMSGIVSECSDVSGRSWSIVELEAVLEADMVYQLKDSAEYVAEVLNEFVMTGGTASVSNAKEATVQLVEFLNEKGFLKLPEGEV